MIFPNLQNADIISIDCETFDPELKEKGPGAVRDGYIVGIAVGIRGAEWYFPIAHEGGGNLDRRTVLRWLSEQLSTNIPKCGANLQYDLIYLWSEGVSVSGPFYDIQIAEPLIDEERFSYSLETLAQDYLGIGKEEEEMSAYIRQKFGAKAGKEKGFIWKCPAHVVAPYAKSDVRLPIAILDKQLEIIKEQGLWDIWQIESDLLPILARMHMNGVRVDVQYAEQLSVEWAAKLVELEKSFEGINAGSSQQIAAELDKLGIPYPRHPPTSAMLKKGITLGNPKLNSKVLATLEDQVPFLGAIRDAKKYRHFLNTFIKGYILNSHVNGRVHASFNQLKGDEYGTVTGRTSTAHPNLANIPNPEKDPYFSQKCRGMFLPETGCEWLRFDLSQMEYRLMVHFASTVVGSGVEKALRMYQEDPATDFHEMCAKLTGLTRKQAKNINFGLCLAEDSMILTDQGLVPIQNITIAHRIWDGVEWVNHEGVVFNGVKEVITYDGVTATPDHIVFTEDGRQVSMREASQEVGRPRLAVSGLFENPVCVSFPGENTRNAEKAARGLQKLWIRSMGRNGQLVEEEGSELPLFDEQERSGIDLLVRTVGLYQSSMQLSDESCVQKLRGERNKAVVDERGVRELLLELVRLQYNYFSEITNRQDKQRRELREREHSLCDTARESSQQKKQYAKVYDIINAGSKNRFTCNGRLVHNCYGMGNVKLADSLGLPMKEAQLILNKYHTDAPFVRAVSSKASERAQARGYVMTLGGRRRRFQMWESAKWVPKEEREKDEDKFKPRRNKEEALKLWGAVRRAHTHKAANAIMQGSNADWLKKAMVMGVRDGVTDVLGMYLNTVYDELGMSIITGDPKHEEACKHMRWIMENAYKLNIPVLVSEGRGANWGLAG